MAIMEKCCCFSNVRSGSLASAIYVIVYCVVNLGVWSYQLTQWINAAESLSDPIYDDLVNGINAAYGINIAVGVFLLIASVLLIIGIMQDIKGLLIPFMVAMVLQLVLQLIAWIIVFVLLGVGAIVFIVGFVFWLGFTALNITCLICVISQYQELRDGRGKASDIV